MEVTVKIINHSEESSVNVVAFGKNSLTAAASLPVAWKVFKLQRGQEGAFRFSDRMEAELVSAKGHVLTAGEVEPGRCYAAVSSLMPSRKAVNFVVSVLAAAALAVLYAVSWFWDVLPQTFDDLFASYGWGAVPVAFVIVYGILNRKRIGLARLEKPAEDQVVAIANRLNEPLVVRLRQDDAVFYLKRLSPGHVFQYGFRPVIYIGAIPGIQQGQIIDDLIMVNVNTEISLKGLTFADIVMTGGGRSGRPFQFYLENIHAA